MKGYPVFLTGLDRRRCVVIGGGAEAERKVRGLLDCDALVTVIAPRVTDGLRQLAERRKIIHVARDYHAGDLEGVFLVIASEQGDAKAACIWEEARAVGALVNVMDDTEHCNFIAGSVVRRGPLTITISTNGCAPALAVRLRERLEREIGPEFGRFCELAAGLRERVARRHPEFERRRRVWYDLVDSDVLELLRKGRVEHARERAAELIDGGRRPEPVGSAGPADASPARH